MRVLATTLALAGCVWATRPATADSPVATPPSPATPADNQLDPAKRDLDKSANGAGRTTKPPAENAAHDAKSVPDAAGATMTATDDANGSDAVAVRKVLADVATAAVSPDHLDRLTQRLAQPDRDRIRTAPAYAGGTAGPALHDAAGQFEGLWQRKYGHPFTSAGAAAALTDVFVSVHLARPEPVDEAQTNATTPMDKSDAPFVATATVAAAHGLPAAGVRLVREMPDGWKLDVPDTVDADAIRKNLVDEIGAVSAIKDRWPADEADGYRAVIHRVLLAVTGRALPAE